MVGAGRHIQEEWFIGSDARHLSRPGYCLVGKVLGHVVVWIFALGNKIAVFKKNGVPLIHVPGIETIEVVETKSIGPTIKWTRRARLPSWSVMILADPGRSITVLT